MKAICVDLNRTLVLRDVPAPGEPPPGHLLIDLTGAAINHGDKAFLANPGAAGSRAADRLYDIWGASAAGTVRSVGGDLAPELVGRGVAVYRSLSKSEHTIGLWSEQMLVPRTSCAVLPSDAPTLEYSGSLVNAITAYAFLELMATEGRKGVIVVAGNSATGRAMAALARERNVPAILLTRSADKAADLKSHGLEHVLVTSEPAFEKELEDLAAELSATAVFDAVGGELTSRIAPALPMYSSINFYGFLGASAPLTISSRLIMAKNLILKRFSNFASPTVSDPAKLEVAIHSLEAVIGHSLFRTRAGETFTLDQIEEAMAYEVAPGAKAVFIPRPPSSAA